jgi:hypothetical protein
VDGYLQKKVVDTVFKKSNFPKCQQFVDATNPVPHVFEYKKGDDPVLLEGNDGHMYPVKILVFPLDEDEPVTQQLLEQFVNDTFIPALMAQDGVYKSSRPTLHPTEGYTCVDAWNKFFGNGEGLIDLWKYHHKESSNENFPTWIKTDPVNLYSCWPVGRIPQDIKQMYVLTAEHMYPVDSTANAPPSAAAADAAEEEDEQEVDNDNQDDTHARRNLGDSLNAEGEQDGE